MKYSFAMTMTLAYHYVRTAFQADYPHKFKIFLAVLNFSFVSILWQHDIPSVHYFSQRFYSIHLYNDILLHNHFYLSKHVYFAYSRDSWYFVTQYNSDIAIQKLTKKVEESSSPAIKHNKVIRVNSCVTLKF